MLLNRWQRFLFHAPTNAHFYRFSWSAHILSVTYLVFSYDTDVDICFFYVLKFWMKPPHTVHLILPPRGRDSNLYPLSGSDVSAGLPTGILQHCGVKGEDSRWGDGGKKKRVQLRFSHFARCATPAGDCWVVWGDTRITRAQLKPLGHFFEEFGDRCLNRQPLLVIAPWNQLLRQHTSAS